MAKTLPSTQSFTEIIDIQDGIVFFRGGYASMILETSAINFYLLSDDEKAARIYGYMSLLNSLSFPIQIFIASRKVDMASYTVLLDKKISLTKKESVRRSLSLYRDFIKNLTREEDLLNKDIYIIIPFSQLELGIKSANLKTLKGKVSESIKTVLNSKKNNIIAQVQRLGLSAKALTNEETIRLFYELFNQGAINVASEANSTQEHNL
ncbi:MAG: hypothetical protein COU27_01620 [Candidatus Levybacteria bacterium CG10_big_fil_rev_8_21_14_0_10_36_7]|nr:MAG: hypothetical protein COU27_01620 [Candidatus Levybacteria bacterium CG10_big_fil_rev_8_21_14_0_10_36_7]